jgi:hypothetical protein
MTRNHDCGAGATVARPLRWPWFPRGGASACDRFASRVVLPCSAIPPTSTPSAWRRDRPQPPDFLSWGLAQKTRSIGAFSIKKASASPSGLRFRILGIARQCVALDQDSPAIVHDHSPTGRASHASLGDFRLFGLHDELHFCRPFGRGRRRRNQIDGNCTQGRKCRA